MIKLLICLSSGVVLAVALLQLRQQRLELAHQQTELHDQIKSQESQLWNQQLQIAVYTGPNAMAQTMNSRHLKMASESNSPMPRSWIDRSQTTDAE
jgi:cell division protein FtsL